MQVVLKGHPELVVTPDHREQQVLAEQRGHQEMTDLPVRPDQVEVPDLRERQVQAEVQVEVEDKVHPE